MNIQVTEVKHIALSAGAVENDDENELLLVDTEIEERLRDPTLTMCDHCVSIYVKEVPPKRPLSPFIFFSQEQRKILKTKNQQWSTKQVMKHLQKTWRGMKASQTQKYRDMSDLDRNRYDRHRKFLREGIKPGTKCDCANLPLPPTTSDQYLLAPPTNNKIVLTALDTKTKITETKMQ